MSKIWVLTKVFLKNGSDSLIRGKKKSMPKSITLMLVMGILMMSIGIPFGAFVGKGYELLLPSGQQGVLLGFALATVSAAIFIFGIFYVLTTFYFAKDIDFLLPLPVKSYHILSAKFITVVVYEYLTEVVLLLPVLIAYGIKSGAGILYYLYSAVIFLTLPVIPLVLSSIINMVIMRFINLGKHKDALRIFGGMLALAVGVGSNLYIQRVTNNGTNEAAFIKILAQGDNSLVQLVTKAFPSARPASLSLINSTAVSGLQNLLIFLVFTAIFFGIFMLLAEALYFRGVVGVSETYSRRRKLNSSELEKATAQNSAVASYTAKELRLLVRTPAYFINCVIIVFLLPVFLLIPSLSQPGLIDAVKGSGKYLNNPELAGIVIAFGFAASLFLGGVNGTASTAISREGQNLYISKYLPMRYKDQIMAKVLSAVILNSAGVIILLIIAGIIARPPIYIILLLFIVGMLGVIFSSFTGIFIDLNSPKLDWDNEYKAVKQNFNMMINMFVCILIAIGLVILAIKLQLQMVYVFIGITVLFSVIDIILYRLLCTVGEKLYNRIQA